MIKLLRRKGLGSKFILAIGKYLYHIVNYYFVDDADILQNTRFEYDIIEGVEIEMYQTI